MIEAMDDEIGRVLVETGLATRGQGGKLVFDPERSDTMIVIMGDNGTYAPGVKAPFNPERAKATVYQTGVWTPLIVAGPLVKGPGRQVSAMVNIADVFGLFGEMAGIDVDKAVPKSRPIDSVSMLPYLENRHQKSLRKTNFTQTQSNLKPAGYVVQSGAVASIVRSPDNRTEFGVVASRGAALLTVQFDPSLANQCAPACQASPANWLMSLLEKLVMEPPAAFTLTAASAYSCQVVGTWMLFFSNRSLR